MRATLLLGAAVWPDGPSPTLQRRAAHAARLFADGRTSHIIPCGADDEALVAAELLRAQGVPGSAIMPETRSRSTWENILFARPILLGLGAEEVVIVTDGYHMPRARLAAARMGLRSIAAPVPWSGEARAFRRRMALREGPALIAYALRRRPPAAD